MRNMRVIGTRMMGVIRVTVRGTRTRMKNMTVKRNQYEDEEHEGLS